MHRIDKHTCVFVWTGPVSSMCSFNNQLVWLCQNTHCTTSVDDSPVGKTFVVSRNMFSFNLLSFTLAYHTLHACDLSLSQSLCTCCLLTTWKCAPLVDLLSRQNEIACHIHPTLCTWDTVTTYTPVTIFFSLGSAKKTAGLQWSGTLFKYSMHGHKIWSLISISKVIF